MLGRRFREDVEEFVNQKERRELSLRLKLAPKAVLIRAVDELIEAEARAQVDAVDRKDDPALGWFADGMETAVEIVQRAIEPVVRQTAIGA